MLSQIPARPFGCGDGPAFIKNVGQTGYPCVAHVAVSCLVKFLEWSAGGDFSAGRKMLIQPPLQKFWRFSNIPPIQARAFPGRLFKYGSEGFFAMTCSFL
jgi:hypothetical protein